MEPILITLYNRAFTALPQEDGTFEIFEKGMHLGRIYAENRIDTELSWHTSDLIDMVLVQQIGEAIERSEK